MDALFRQNIADLEKKIFPVLCDLGSRHISANLETDFICNCKDDSADNFHICSVDSL